MGEKVASRKLSKHADTFVGIDFGTTKVCVVIGHQTPEGLEILGVGKQPSLGIRKGVVVNIPLTVEALKKAIEVAELMTGHRVSEAYVGIAGSHIRGFNSSGVVPVKGKEVTPLDIDRAIEAAKAVAIPFDREVLHVIPQEYMINDQDGVKDPLGMSGVRLESKVHIVTGAGSSAQNIVKCAELAGVQVLDVILEPLASAEAVLTRDERELGVALIDIGGGTTDVALFVRGSVVHTGVIPMGGNHITNDIAVGLRTSIQDAENIKIAYGCAMSSTLNADQSIEVPVLGGKKSKEVSRSVLARIIEPRMEEIFQLAAKEISSSGFKHLLSTGAVLTGGASLLEGALELSEFILEMPVRRGIPQVSGSLKETISSPVYSTAVGLLVYGMKNEAPKNKFHRQSGVYSQVVNKMRHWLSEVF